MMLSNSFLLQNDYFYTNTMPYQHSDKVTESDYSALFWWESCCSVYWSVDLINLLSCHIFLFMFGSHYKGTLLWHFIPVHCTERRHWATTLVHLIFHLNCGRVELVSEHFYIQALDAINALTNFQLAPATGGPKIFRWKFNVDKRMIVRTQIRNRRTAKYDHDNLFFVYDFGVLLDINIHRKFQLATVTETVESVSYKNLAKFQQDHVGTDTCTQMRTTPYLFLCIVPMGIKRLYLNSEFQLSFWLHMAPRS